MTQEEKDLLLRDLCGRLPYGVICRTRKEYSSDCDFVDKVPFVGILIDVCYDVKKVTLKSTPFTIRENYDFSVEEIIPYLRPMSSMTEDERKEYERFSHFSIGLAPILMDWIYSHHLDCCGLIEKGLALEAPEGMYNIN